MTTEPTYSLVAASKRIEKWLAWHVSEQAWEEGVGCPACLATDARLESKFANHTSTCQLRRMWEGTAGEETDGPQEPISGAVTNRSAETGEGPGFGA